MQATHWRTRLGVFVAAGLALGSLGLDAGSVHDVGAAVSCPNGLATFNGYWSATTTIIPDDDSPPVTINVGGGVTATSTFVAANHTFTGTVFLANLNPGNPSRDTLSTAGTYDCVNGTISGTATNADGAGHFEGNFNDSKTGITTAVVSTVIVGLKPRYVYDNFFWTGGLQTGYVQETGTDITTDPDNTGATPSDPEQVSVESPTSGTLSITSSNAPNNAIGGYYILAPTQQIVAPAATAGDPLALTFTIDGSLVGNQTPALFRDSARVPACATQPSTVADPDPCVSTQTQLPDGDWQIIVLSSHASVWTVGIHATKPSAPRVVSTAPGKGQATVSWSAPASNGGAPITKFVVTPYLGSVAKPARTFAKSAKSGVVPGLVNGKSYTFKVAAANVMGTSARSAASAAVKVGAPSAPNAVSAKRVSSGTLSVSFHPGPNNGARVTQYSATCSPVGGGAAKSANGAVSPVVVKGPGAGHAYTCRVRATNSRGAGPLSAPSVAVSA